MNLELDEPYVPDPCVAAEYLNIRANDGAGNLLRGDSSTHGKVLKYPLANTRFCLVFRGCIITEPFGNFIKKLAQSAALDAWGDTAKRPVVGLFARYINEMAPATLPIGIFRNLAIPRHLASNALKEGTIKELSRFAYKQRMAIGASWTSKVYYTLKLQALRTSVPGPDDPWDTCPVCKCSRVSIRHMFLSCTGDNSIVAARLALFDSIEYFLANVECSAELREMSSWEKGQKISQDFLRQRDCSHENFKRSHPTLAGLGWLIPDDSPLTEAAICSHQCEEDIWDLGYRLCVPKQFSNFFENDIKDSLITLAQWLAIGLLKIKIAIDAAIDCFACHKIKEMETEDDQEPNLDLLNLHLYPCSGDKCKNAFRTSGKHKAMVNIPGLACQHCGEHDRVCKKIDILEDVLIRHPHIYRKINNEKLSIQQISDLLCNYGIPGTERLARAILSGLGLWFTTTDSDTGHAYTCLPTNTPQLIDKCICICTASPPPGPCPECCGRIHGATDLHEGGDSSLKCNDCKTSWDLTEISEYAHRGVTPKPWLCDECLRIYYIRWHKYSRNSGLSLWAYKRKMRTIENVCLNAVNINVGGIPAPPAPVARIQPKAPPDPQRRRVSQIAKSTLHRETFSAITDLDPIARSVWFLCGKSFRDKNDLLANKTQTSRGIVYDACVYNKINKEIFMSKKVEWCKCAAKVIEFIVYNKPRKGHWPPKRVANA